MEIKPTVSEYRVAALMTAPRYENVFARNHIEMALRAVGIPLQISQGVFYGQCMQRMMEQCCDLDLDVILTVDFDSLFTADHVKRLLGIMATDSNIDAVASMQARRGSPLVLATIKDQTSHECDGNPFQVSTAHFGLTAIRVDKLKQLPKPWFASRPDSKGEWSDDKIDDDIWFWFQWKMAGFNVFVDPQTRIGHLEEMVIRFDENLKAEHIYPAQWREENGLHNG